MNWFLRCWGCVITEGVSLWSTLVVEGELGDASLKMDLASLKAAAIIDKAAAILRPRRKFQHSVINLSSFTLKSPPPLYYINGLKWFHPYSSSYRESASNYDYLRMNRTRRQKNLRRDAAATLTPTNPSHPRHGSFGQTSARTNH